MSSLFDIDVTVIEPQRKHPTIFERYDELQPGNSLVIHNDHDPKPLYYQLIGEKGNYFTWEYLEQGPDWWKVKVTKRKANEGPTVGELAAADVRKAEVFKRFGLEFCCGGKKSLKQACEDKNLDLTLIEKELEKATATGSSVPTFDFSNWELNFLADYIYNQHHRYWYREEPVITELVYKVAGKHGDRDAELLTIKDLYTTLRSELNTHFIKEERILFPHIKALVLAKNNGADTVNSPLENIQQPLQMMEADHEAAGEILLKIREYTNNYIAPEEACNSYRLMYYKLSCLEEDLHQHIHLENNILFPKAALLHRELVK